MDPQPLSLSPTTGSSLAATLVTIQANASAPFFNSTLADTQIDSNSGGGYCRFGENVTRASYIDGLHISCDAPPLYQQADQLQAEAEGEGEEGRKRQLERGIARVVRELDGSTTVSVVVSVSMNGQQWVDVPGKFDYSGKRDIAITI